MTEEVSVKETLIIVLLETALTRCGSLSVSVVILPFMSA